MLHQYYSIIHIFGTSTMIMAMYTMHKYINTADSSSIRG